MSSPAVAARHELYGALSAVDAPPIGRDERTRALDRFFSTPSGREKPGRFWRFDFETFAPQAAAIDLSPERLRIENNDARAIACDLQRAAREHPQLLARAFGTTELPASKFGALATAFAHLGYFIWVPADHACAQPIVVTYDAPPGAAIFPYGVVLAERGARLTVVERITGAAGAFVCSAAEIVTEERADVVYAVVQRAESARIVST
ncbi:MAG: hypothetical protein WA814_11215, partial [Candidatus Baltobacteraceae bacterium]